MRHPVWMVLGEAFDTGLIVGLSAYQVSRDARGAVLIGGLAVVKALHALFTPPPAAPQAVSGSEAKEETPDGDPDH